MELAGTGARKMSESIKSMAVALGLLCLVGFIIFFLEQSTSPDPGWWWLAAAALCACPLVYRFRRHLDQPSDQVQAPNNSGLNSTLNILLLLGVLVGLALTWLCFIYNSAPPTRVAVYAFRIWLAYVIGLGLAAIYHPIKQFKISPQKLWENTAIFIVAAVAFLSRLLFLEDVPYGIMNDEFQAVDDAISIKAGTIPAPFSYGAFNVSHLFSYFIAFFLTLFPDHPVLAGRLPNALAGALLTVTIFILIKVSTSNYKVALAAAALSCASSWQIVISRFTYSMQISPFLSSLTLACLCHCLLNKSWRASVLAGISMGLNVMILYVGSLTMLTACLLFSFDAIREKSHRVAKLKLFILYLVVSVTVALPSFLFLYKSGFETRHRQILRTFVGEDQLFSAVLTRLSVAFHYFAKETYGWCCFTVAEGAPLLDKYIFSLAFLGFIYALFKFYKQGYFLFLVHFIVMLIPFVVAPEMQSYRLLGTSISVFFFAGISAVIVYEIVSSALPKRKILSFLLVAACFGFVQGRSMLQYFESSCVHKPQYAWYDNDRGKTRLQASLIKRLLDTQHLVFVAPGQLSTLGLAAQIYPHAVNQLHVIPGFSALPLAPDIRAQKVAFFVNAYATPQFPYADVSLHNLFAFYYPGGTYERAFTPDGIVDAMIYRLNSAEDASSLYGSKVDVRPSAAAWAQTNTSGTFPCGVVAEYFESSDCQGAPLLTRRDLEISLRYTTDLPAAANCIRWQGLLSLKGLKTPQIEIRSNNIMSIELDAQSEDFDANDVRYQRKLITVTSKTQSLPITVKYILSQRPAYFELMASTGMQFEGSWFPFQPLNTQNYGELERVIVGNAG